MIKHWERHGPPVYISVASYLGLVKPATKKTTTKTAPKSDSDNEANLEALASMFGSSSGVF